jgi:hypothetical protein
MKPKLLIRIAAVLMFLHMVGHSFGVLGSRKAPNPTIGRILHDMNTNFFPFMGRSASLGIFFQGYGMVLIFDLLFTSLVLWWLAAKTETELGQKLLFASCIYLSALSLMEVVYKFPFFLTIPSALCLLIALVKSSPRRIFAGAVTAQSK